MKSLCSECEKETNQQVIVEHKMTITEKDDDGYPYWWEEHKYQVVSCKGCDTVSFRKLLTDSSMEDRDGYTTSQEIYPYRSVFSLSIKALLNTPQNVKAIYKETIESFNSNLNILCGAGIRAIIEAICIDKKILSGSATNKKGELYDDTSLYGKIQGLMQQGHITEESASFLHELRFLGNKAVHEIEAASLDELRIAISIVETTIDNLYELKHKVMKLKEASAKRKAKPAKIAPFSTTHILIPPPPKPLP